jgi:hypothetical protein
MKSLLVKVPDNIHRAIKIKAAELGLSMQQFMINWLETEMDPAQYYARANSPRAIPPPLISSIGKVSEDMVSAVVKSYGTVEAVEPPPPMLDMRKELNEWREKHGEVNERIESESAGGGILQAAQPDNGSHRAPMEVLAAMGEASQGSPGERSEHECGSPVTSSSENVTAAADGTHFTED